MNNSTQKLPQSSEYLGENSSGKVVASTSVILILATFLLALRFYSRLLTKTPSSWDDILLLPAWMFLVGACIVAYGKNTISMAYFATA